MKLPLMNVVTFVAFFIELTPISLFLLERVS